MNTRCFEKSFQYLKNLLTYYILYFSGKPKSLHIDTPNRGNTLKWSMYNGLEVFYKVELRFVCTYNFTIESVKINGKSCENVDG